LRSISSADGPLSVAEIHERSGRMVRGTGIAPIYRGIKALREAGEVVAVELPGEETRYEPASRGHHHHFRCRSCERVYDLEVCPSACRRAQHYLAVTRSRITASRSMVDARTASPEFVRGRAPWRRGFSLRHPHGPQREVVFGVSLRERTCSSIAN